MYLVIEMKHTRYANYRYYVQIRNLSSPVRALTNGRNAAQFLRPNLKVPEDRLRRERGWSSRNVWHFETRIARKLRTRSRFAGNSMIVTNVAIRLRNRASFVRASCSLFARQTNGTFRFFERPPDRGIFQRTLEASYDDRSKNV